MAQETKPMSFSEIRRAMMAHYRAGHPLDAVKVVRENAPRFPAFAHLFMFWEASLLSSAEQTGEALRILERMIKDGYWWLPEILTEEEDFAPLRKNARFVRIVEVCRSRAAIARDHAKPLLEVVSAEDTVTRPLPLLVFLHGWGSRPALIRQYFHDLSKRGWLIALPQSSMPVSADTFAWDDAERAEQEISRHLDALVVRFPVDASRIVVGGFSQGGGLSVRLALNTKLGFSGFIAVSPARLDPANLPEPEAGARIRRGVVFTGALDERWSPAALALNEWMQAHSLPCQIHTSPDLGHEFPENFSTTIRQHLEFITNA